MSLTTLCIDDSMSLTTKSCYTRV